MNPDRLIKRIFTRDYNLCKSGVKKLKIFFELIECQQMFTNKLASNLTTVENMYNDMLKIDDRVCLICISECLHHLL